MLELLAPAGSMEAVVAAVENGANAVYLGYGDFNARRNAKNFSREEFAEAVSYCHVRGTKVYLTLNTLLSDRELPRAAEVAAHASAIGVDAVLVQDLGVLHMVRQAAPDMPIHASTQMTISNLDGVKKVADLGMTRAVLSRELSRDQIEYICQRSPIEIEVFAHGALCMCYSGQCFLSSVIGGRSGNRGLCAQPCRMKYGWNGKADGNPLSLKDLTLAGHLKELRKMGVTCVKLEGRMKRPEYVAVVTRIFATAIREGREPTAEEMAQLEAAFSRQGFTQGYYLDRKGPDMFGVREETKDPKELFAQARMTYQGGEAPRVPITFYAMVRKDEPVQVGVKDPEERVVTVEGPVPEIARNRPLTEDVVTTQLSRTGGTPYFCEQVRALVDEGLSLPLSALNALRRDALERLTDLRKQPPERRTGEYHAGVRYENRGEEPELTISIHRADQMTAAVLDAGPAMIYVPLHELCAHPELTRAMEYTRLAVSLPRIAWDREMDELNNQLSRAYDMGVRDALVGNLGLLDAAKKAGFTVHGDYGLEIFNSQALKEIRHMGVETATLSFELKMPQIRDISKNMGTELITYGRLPLMVMENDIGTGNKRTLTDRKGAHFPVLSAPGGRSELFNSQILFLADKYADYRRLGLWAQRLMFTTETPEECDRVIHAYQEEDRWAPNGYTRGLYYRDVE